MIIRSTTLKRKLQQVPPSTHVVSKKLRSKLPRRRRHQISPVLLASTRFKLSTEKPPLSVISVDSSSASDFAAGEDSCNSSRASAVFAGKFRSSSRIPISGDFGDVRKNESVNLLRNQLLKKRNESEVEVSESSCVDSNSGAHDRIRSLILKFRNGKDNEEVSEVCTKSEITFAEQISVENSKSSKGNLNRNDIVSVSSDVRKTSFEEEKSRCKENRASESEREIRENSETASERER